METIGIRELKTRASEVVRRVRDTGEVFQISRYGRIVARIVPVVSAEDLQSELDSGWARLDDLAAEIGRRWPDDLSAAEALAEDRGAR